MGYIALIFILLVIFGIVIYKGWPKVNKTPFDDGLDHWIADIYFDKSASNIGKYLVVDIETTGLPKNRYNMMPEDLMNWPRIVQIAWYIFDNEFKWVEAYNYIVKQIRRIPPDAVKIHGITDEIAEKEGVVIGQVLEMFQKALNQVDIVIAHNIDFDIPIIDSAFVRNGYKRQFGEKTLICTMLSSVNFCRIRTEWGYKWPTLLELYKKCYYPDYPGKIRIDTVHDAWTDVHLAAKCFMKLKEKGIVHDKDTKKISYIKTISVENESIFNQLWQDQIEEFSKPFKKVSNYQLSFQYFKDNISFNTGEKLKLLFWGKEFYRQHPYDLNIRLARLNDEVVGEVNDRRCFRTLRAYFEGFDFDVTFLYSEGSSILVKIHPFKP